MRLHTILLTFLLASCGSIPKNFKGSPLTVFSEDTKFNTKDSADFTRLYILYENKSKESLKDKPDDAKTLCNGKFNDVASKFSHDRFRQPELPPPEGRKIRVEDKYCEVIGLVKYKQLEPGEFAQCTSDAECTMATDACNKPVPIHSNHLPKFLEISQEAQMTANCEKSGGVRASKSSIPLVVCENKKCVQKNLPEQHGDLRKCSSSKQCYVVTGYCGKSFAINRAPRPSDDFTFLGGAFSYVPGEGKDCKSFKKKSNFRARCEQKKCTVKGG